MKRHHKMDCEHCAHAIRNEPRKVYRMGNMTFVQNGAGYTCTTQIQELSSIDDEIYCSEFKEGTPNASSSD